jgi:ActR/RegA family two-component response regulator
MKGIFKHLRERFTSTALPVKSALPVNSSGKNVLVVDADDALCRIVQRMLSDEQYQVQTSQCAADAVRAIAGKQT